MIQKFKVFLFCFVTLFVALWFLFIGFSYSDSGFSLAVGFSWLIIPTLLVFGFKKWIRISAMLVSILVLIVCLFDYIAAQFIDRFFLMGTIFYSPGILPGILAIFCLKTKRNENGVKS